MFTRAGSLAVRSRPPLRPPASLQGNQVHCAWATHICRTSSMS